MRSTLRSAILRVSIAILRIAVFFIVIDAATFVLFDFLPDSALSQIGLMGVDPELLAQTRARLGVSGPWYQRYVQHWVRMAQGDLGKTLVGGFPIADVITARLQVSAQLWLGVLALLVLIPIPVAYVASSRGSPTVGVRGLRIAGHLSAAPSFLTAIVLSGIWVLVLGRVTGFASSARLVLTVLSCGALPVGVALTAAVNSYQSCLQEPFVDTYRMLGMSDWRIKRLLFRNVRIVMRPLLARLVLGLLIGTVFAEIAFGYQGVGFLFVEALRASDLNVMRIWVLGSGWCVLILTEAERR